jgi:hypothetical protein
VNLKTLFFFIFISSIAIPAFGQQNDSTETNPFSDKAMLYIPAYGWMRHTIDRADILAWKKRKEKRIFTNIYPYNTGTLFSSVEGMKQISRQDKANAEVMKNLFDWQVQVKKPILKVFYRHPSYLYSVNKKNFQLGINPLFHFEGGIDNLSENVKFVNTRGIELRGVIGRRVSFYTSLTDNQANFATFVNQRIDSNQRVIPGAGRSKPFKENAYDFSTVTGYVSFKIIPEIALQFGQDKNFIGNGFRSLFLSDDGNNYFFLKLQTKVWRIHYMNLFTEMIDSENDFTVDGAYLKKYVAMHHLSIDILDNLNIGVFEGVIHSDSVNPGFQLSYLNPIIFYRTIEYMLGSADNVVIGIDWKYNFLKHFSFYGQVLIDEFKFWELANNTGWWANKYGLQGGLKYYDAFSLSTLDLQVEYNRVRPYTYAHSNVSNNYSQYGQSLAHPVGANLSEWVLLARYQPITKLFLYTRLILNNYGGDSNGSNWGNNIFLSNTTRMMDFDNKTGQGIKTNILNFNFTASYMLADNIFVDLNFTQRNLTSVDLPQRNANNNYISIAFRMNMAKKDYGF